jgi:hypothetical protein
MSGKWVQVAPELSGRELDAAVAEHVMGFTRAPEPPHPTDNRAINGVLYYLPGTPWDRNQQNIVPYFSEDIAAAMQVVEKMRGSNYWFALEQEDDWAAVFYDKDRVWYPQHAETAPLAICLAALKAIEGKQK